MDKNDKLYKEYQNSIDQYIDKFNEEPPAYGFDFSPPFEKYISLLNKSVETGRKIRVKRDKDFYNMIF